MTLNDPQVKALTWFQGLKSICQNRVFDVVQMHIIHLLNHQRNVPLMHGPSAIAEPLVKYVIPAV